MACASRKFQCPVPRCSCRFYSLVDLEEHQEDYKHFVCMTCKETFVANYYLQEHVKGKTCVSRSWPPSLSNIDKPKMMRQFTESPKSVGVSSGLSSKEKELASIKEKELALAMECEQIVELMNQNGELNADDKSKGSILCENIVDKSCESIVDNRESEDLRRRNRRREIVDRARYSRRLTFEKLRHCC